MNDWHRPIHEDELRRMLRVASGCTLGFVLCKLMNWNYGVFYTVPPVILLGMIPAFNVRAVLENISAAVLCCLQVGLIGGF